MVKIFKFAKEYLTLIKEGYSFKDKIVIASYFLSFIYNLLIKNKKHNLFSNVTLKNEDGIFFCSNNIFSVVCGSSFYEPKVRKIISKNIKEGVFIDVGANIGKYAIMVGRRLKNKGKVIAIEPMPENFEILKKNIKLNNLRNVIPVKCALGNEEGEGFLYLETKGKGAHSLLSNSPYVTQNKIKVKIRKLDNVLKELKIEKVDLIKIDVEGFEAEVLKGARKTLKKYHPKIIFEAWNENYLKRVKEILKPFNYKIKKIDDVNYFAY